MSRHQHLPIKQINVIRLQTLQRLIDCLTDELGIIPDLAPAIRRDVGAKLGREEDLGRCRHVSNLKCIPGDLYVVKMGRFVHPCACQSAQTTCPTVPRCRRIGRPSPSARTPTHGRGPGA